MAIRKGYDYPHIEKSRLHWGVWVCFLYRDGELLQGDGRTPLLAYKSLCTKFLIFKHYI